MSFFNPSLVKSLSSTGIGGALGGGGSTPSGTMAELLLAGVPESNEPTNLLDHNGNIIRSAIGDGVDWIVHPGRGWSVPTEMLEVGNYGFTIESGSIDQGSVLGDKIIFTVNNSNAPTLRWRFAGDNTTGQFSHPWTFALQVSISTTGTLAEDTILLMTTMVKGNGSEIGGGLEKWSGQWRSLSRRTGVADLRGSLAFTEAHLTANINNVASQLAARLGVSDQNFCTSWTSPASAATLGFAHASAQSQFDGWSSDVANDWYIETTNFHPGGLGPDAVVTIDNVLIIPHPKTQP